VGRAPPPAADALVGLQNRVLQESGLSVRGDGLPLGLMFVYDITKNPLNTNEWAFPLCECLHIAAFAFSLGTVALIDLRMLGLGIVQRGVVQLLRDTEILTIIGLIVVIVSGLAIFSSDPIMYIHNRPFQVKMVMLVVAIVFNYTIHRRVVLQKAAPAIAIPVAVVSLALWWSLVFCGLFIGFY
jgi:hypothetical protein